MHGNGNWNPLDATPLGADLLRVTSGSFERIDSSYLHVCSRVNNDNLCSITTAGQMKYLDGSGRRSGGGGSYWGAIIPPQGRSMKHWTYSKFQIYRALRLRNYSVHGPKLLWLFSEEPSISLNRSNATGPPIYTRGQILIFILIFITSNEHHLKLIHN